MRGVVAKRLRKEAQTTTVGMGKHVTRWEYKRLKSVHKTKSRNQK